MRENSKIRFADEAVDNSRSSFRRASGDEDGATSPESFTMSRGGDVNRKAKAASELFRVENAVFENMVMALQGRSLVQTNSALIQKNYSSAFAGNRQLAYQNTEDIFRNRLAILSTWAAGLSGPIQAAYAEALTHREKISFLRHRVKLHKQVVDITLSMAGVNAKAIEVNQAVMDTNEEIVAFNHAYIEENTSWLEGGLSADEATSTSVEALAKANSQTVGTMERQAASNTTKLVDGQLEAETNRDSITANEADIYLRRVLIMSNREVIRAHQDQVLARAHRGLAAIE